MRRLHRFLALSSCERRLVVEAAFCLAAIRLALRVLRFRTLWAIVNRAPRASRCERAPGGFSAERIAWAVAVVSPYVVGVKPCLTQALAAQVLLVRRGLPARLRLGVARGEQGEVQAHAWTETAGKVVSGGSAAELERFTPLLALDATTP